MIYFILIISIVFSILLSFNQFFLLKLERGFKNDCTDSFIEKISNINEEIHVVYGKFYAYNPLNKKIIIEKKDVYHLLIVILISFISIKKYYILK